MTILATAEPVRNPRAPLNEQIQIILDKNKKSSKLKFIIKNKIPSLKQNLIIVVGGDGFMLQTLKRNENSKTI